MSNKLLSKNVLRKAVGYGLATAIGMVGLLGLKSLNDAERRGNEADQRAAADVLESALDSLGAQALGFVESNQNDSRIAMTKDEKGNYRITFKGVNDRYTDTERDGTVVMGSGPNGKPDPTQTRFVDLTSGSKYHKSHVTLVSPEGQSYDGDAGASSGYEGRYRQGVDLDGDSSGDVGGFADTTQPGTAYRSSPADRAGDVADAADHALGDLGSALTRGANTPHTPTS